MLKTAKVIFEDNWVMVVSKPSGMVVNRSDTNKEGTLQDELSGYFRLGSSLGIGDRAGIVHRLDRETSGLILVAKTQKAFENLQAQFKNRQVEKEYIALVHGKTGDESGSIEAKIARIGKFGKFGVVDRRSDGREARTDWEVIALYKFQNAIGSNQSLRGAQRRSNLEKDRFASLAMTLGNLTKSRLNYLKQNAREYSLLRILPKTGRTHQIRVHLKYIGHPVVADLIYGPSKLIKLDLRWCPRLFLHASSLAFVHPKTNKSLKFESDLPNDLKHAILNLRKT